MGNQRKRVQVMKSHCPFSPFVVYADDHGGVARAYVSVAVGQWEARMERKSPLALIDLVVWSMTAGEKWALAVAWVIEHAA